MPKVKYAGMLQYDGDLCIPKSFLVNPPEIRNTLTELLVANGVQPSLPAPRRRSLAM